jgi:hypothetical protein
MIKRIKIRSIRKGQQNLEGERKQYVKILLACGKKRKRTF